MKTMIKAVILSFGLATGAMAAEPMRPAPADVGQGRIAWFDITTTNLAKSREFYEKLFDWQFAALAGTTYAVEIVSRGTPIGTLRVAGGPVAPHNGVVYVQVDDALVACNKAKELG